MYRFGMAAAMAVLASGCGGLVEQRSTLEMLPDVVDGINRTGSSELSQQIPGATMKARIEDGSTLVLMMGNVPLGNQSYDPNALRRTLRPQVCGSDDFRELIDEGGKIRVEMTTNFGKELPAIQFARC